MDMCTETQQVTQSVNATYSSRYCFTAGWWQHHGFICKNFEVLQYSFPSTHFLQHFLTNMSWSATELQLSHVGTNSLTSSQYLKAAHSWNQSPTLLTPCWRAGREYHDPIQAWLQCLLQFSPYGCFDMHTALITAQSCNKADSLDSVTHAVFPKSLAYSSLTHREGEELDKAPYLGYKANPSFY